MKGFDGQQILGGNPSVIRIPSGALRIAIADQIKGRVNATFSFSTLANMGAWIVAVKKELRISMAISQKALVHIIEA